MEKRNTKKYIKIYEEQFKEFNDCNIDKKINFCNRLKNLNSD